MQGLFLLPMTMERGFSRESLMGHEIGGATLGLVGIDLQTGQARLSFGIPDLLDGIEVTTLAVALFAIGEALKVAAQPMADEEIETVRAIQDSLQLTLD